MVVAHAPELFSPSMSADDSASRRSWNVLLLLLPVAMLNYLDRQMLASMKFSVMADIPDIRTDARWGYMLGQFKWVYAVLSLVGGYIADRFSRRVTICSSLFVWSLVTWATGHVSSFHQLLLVRSIMGISEAFYIPAALALITDYHTGPTRSLAVGLHQVAIYCGVILGGATGYVADAPSLGWRRAFDGCGLFGVLYAVLLVSLLREIRKPATASTDDELTDPRPSPLAAAGELLTNPSYLLLVVYFTLPALAGWVVRDWMPTLFKEQFHLNQGHAGVAATLYWQTAAAIGAAGGGLIADRWMRRNRRGRIYASAIGSALLVPAIFGVGAAGSLGVAIVFLILFGLGYGVFDANNMPILSQITRPHLRATGYGLMNCLSISAGGLADWGFGVLRDRHVSNQLVFGLFSLVAALSAVVVLLIRPRAELIAPKELS